MQDIRGEWVLRFLSQKGVSYGSVGGGVPSVVLQDVLRALSAKGVRGFSFDFLMMYMAGSVTEAEINRISISAYIWASGIAADNKWRMVKKQEVLRPCVVNVVRELLRPELIRCDACQGVGTTKHLKVCPHCDKPKNEDGQISLVGSGIKRPKSAFYCESLGVGRTQWTNVWSGRHETLKAELLNIINLSASLASKAIDSKEESYYKMTA